MRQRAAALYESGMTYGQVGEAVGCCLNTARNMILELGVEPRTSGRRRLIGRYGSWCRRKQSNGYIVWSAWDAETKQSAFILEHRIVMSWMLGRWLQRHETVHHRNGVRDDNRPENLELWVTAQPAGMSHCPHCGGSLTAIPAS